MSVNTKVLHFCLQRGTRQGLLKHACGLDNTVDDDVLFYVLSSKSKQEVLPGKIYFKKECQLLLRMSSINFSLYYS